MRHGETVYNLQEKVQGWNDSPLTELGIYQAKCAGYGLRNTSFRIAYSGDALRQINTAKAFMQENNHPVEIIPDWHFREMNYGKYEDGSYKDMLGPLFDEINEPYSGYVGLYRHYGDFQIAEELFKRDETGIFEGEKRVWKRVSEGLEMICKEYDDGNILVSTSSFAIAATLHHLFPDFVQPRLVENASITIVSFDGSYRLQDYNNIEYRKIGEEYYSLIK